MAKATFLGGEFQGIDNNGNPLAGGLVYFYEPGTSTDKTVYKDSTLSVAHTQPVVLNSNGRMAIWMNGSYKVVLRDSAGVLVYDEDNVNTETTASTETGVSVVNGSFENDTVTTGQPDSWTVAAATNGTIAIDVTNQKHGLQSLKFTSTDANGAGTAVSTRFDVSAGGEIDIRFSYFSSSATSTNVVEIKWYNAAGSTIATDTVHSLAAGNPTSWTDYIYRVAVNATAVHGEIILTGVKAGGTTMVATTSFDDVTADYNREKVVKTVSVSSAVNEITVTDAAIGNKPAINQTGTDDVGLDIEGVEIKNGKIPIVTANSVTTNTLQTATTNGDLAISRNGTGDLTLDSVPIYGLVILDTPIPLLNATAATTSWQSVSNTTLVNASAKKAIIRSSVSANSTSVTSVVTSFFLKNPDVALAADNTTRVALAESKTASNAFNEAAQVSEVVVNLSTLSRFDWYFTSDGNSANSAILTLVGYYK